MRGTLRSLLVVWAGVVSFPLEAVRPMSLHVELVAGQGVAGRRDGSFLEARFTEPLGLALGGDGTILYVADSGSHSIRLVRLGGANDVVTLAGTGEPGAQDGALDRATFFRPSALVALGGNRLLVNDSGSGRLRLIDVGERRVKTIPSDGSVSLEGIFGLVYQPSTRLVYFTQPEAGAVRRLDLDTSRVETLFERDSNLPHPGPVALHKGEVVVADAGGAVYQIVPEIGGAHHALLEVGRARNVVALGSSGGRLYALRSGSVAPWISLSDMGTPPVTLVSSRGEPLRLGKGVGEPFLDVEPDLPVGFLEVAERTFYVSSGHRVVGLRDLAFDRTLFTHLRTPTGLSDLEYPIVRERGTHRLLVLGDSHALYVDPAEPDPGQARLLTVPKRLEIELNARSALGDGEVRRHEVLAAGRVAWHPFLVFLNREAPDVAHCYDPDEVLILLPNGINVLTAYLDRPIAQDGLPAAHPDSEFVLLPWKEKLRQSPLGRLYDLCQRHPGWARPVSETMVQFEGVETLASDPVVRRALLDLYQQNLAPALRGLSGGGHRRVMAAYLPPGRRGSFEVERAFYRELCEREGLVLVDVTERFWTLRDSLFPLSEATGYDHYRAEGHAWLARLLADELFSRKLIPF